MPNIKSNCPVCDAPIDITDGTEESEIIPCRECRTRLVVEKIGQNQAVLNKAPEVEEDWGE